MFSKYRIFYDLHYRGDVLDYTEDIKAETDQEAIQKAKRFIKRKNEERKEETRKICIRNGLHGAEHFTDRQLLTGNYFKLSGVSHVIETLTMVEVKKEDLQTVIIQ
jgi:hypothetical protein